MAARRRLDAELMRRRLFASREQAQAAIAAGKVTVGGAPARKASRQVDPAEAIEILGDPPPFVSRAGHKLDAALDHFGVDVVGLRVIDCGASTGGFTDCVLQRGASRVVALDVGRGQLHEKMLADDRVTSMERTNLRDVVPAMVGGPAPVVVADLSFISLITVLEPLLALVAPDGAALVLIKPQFEAGRRIVSRGQGVVRDPEVWRSVLVDVSGAFGAAGAAMMGLMVSPLTGSEGNVEFLAHFEYRQDRHGDAAPARSILIEHAVEAAGAMVGPR